MQAKSPGTPPEREGLFVLSRRLQRMGRVALDETTDIPAFSEHWIAHDDRGSVHVRDFPGSGPAFVLLHGFAANSHIYDDLIPHLASAGRRIITIDFLGFSASDKPVGSQHSFAQQLGDEEAVVEALSLDTFIPVGHDARGPAAVNFALSSKYISLIRKAKTLSLDGTHHGGRA
jgi:pimeloyl-ACP methyl ester carboxylesterase